MAAVLKPAAIFFNELAMSAAAAHCNKALVLVDGLLAPLEALEGEMAPVLARLDIEAAVELVAVDTADTAAELTP